jgi:AraC-like DNA-binding protein
VSTLCGLIGMGERTLRACCGTFLGMGPARYLRLRRLKMVRAAMLRADPDTARVTEIAKRYGFNEAGRFTASYRMAYGENPSATLARLRNRIHLTESSEFA